MGRRIYELSIFALAIVSSLSFTYKAFVMITHLIEQIYYTTK